MKWILKAIIQKGISWMPNSQKINFLFQKHVTKGVQLSDQYFGDKLGHACDHLRLYKECGTQKSFEALELGSGWYPVVPIALYLSGATKITSIDISPLMNKEGIVGTANKYLEWHSTGKLDVLKPYIIEERWSSLEQIAKDRLNLTDLLAKLHLDLLIKDARSTGFENDSLDLVCSNNTYEHIYPDILRDIISEFQRIVKPAGVNSHFIDMSDHFAHLDQSITIYNYLKFTEKQWDRIDNSVQPQNRMRLSDYEKMYQEAQIEIVKKETRPGNLNDLRKVTLSHQFANYDQEDLAISHVHLVSSK